MPAFDNPDQPNSPGSHARSLIGGLTFEVVPMKGIEAAVLALPENAEVSVTCSPKKGIAETQLLTETLAALGHRPIPHLSARMVRDSAHAAELAEWCRAHHLSKVFLIAGDPADHGAYAGVTDFLDDFLTYDHGLNAIGVAAYPDGHPFLSPEQLHQALHAKAQLLGDAGVDGWASTQMCFNPETIVTWLTREREHGLALPVHLGVCGVVAKTKLLKLGMRLGVGQSLSYLRKNRAATTAMLTSPYSPDDLLRVIIPQAGTLGIDDLHVFTFNQIAPTEAWRQAHLSDPPH